MLGAEVVGEHFNKTEHRNQLMPRLSGRTPAAVERKHQNISAILREEGRPFVDGYKPLGNYQGALRDEVMRFLQEHPEFDRLIDRIEGELPVTSSLALPDPRDAFVDPPDREEIIVSKRTGVRKPPVFYDFALRDERIRRLGTAGEEFVFRLERHRLERDGRSDLAKKVEWVSESRGDGAGFDVLSFDKAGEERFVEVKTTNFGWRYPFVISRNEVDFSDENERQFLLYRVFHFSRNPRLYSLPGSVRESCQLDPILYEGRP